MEEKVEQILKHDSSFDCIGFKNERQNENVLMAVDKPAIKLNVWGKDYHQN